MKRIKYWIRNYFGFSKTESNGMLILIPSMFIIIAFPYLHRRYVASDKIISFDKSKNQELIAQLEKKIERTEAKVERPNFKPKAKRWAEKEQKDDNKRTSTKEKVKEREKLITYDLNLADTTQLRSVYGIGSVLSNRIIKYRQLLGGFTSKNQLQEVYGLEDSVISKLNKRFYISLDFEPKRLKLNSDKSYVLDDHPYITKKIASAIDAYRFQHGAFKSVDDLNQIVIFDSSTVKKISPYLSLE